MKSENGLMRLMVAPVVVGLIVGIVAPIVTEVVRDQLKQKSVTIKKWWGPEKKSNGMFQRSWFLEIKSLSIDPISDVNVAIHVKSEGVSIARHDRFSASPPEDRPDVTRKKEPDNDSYRGLTIRQFRSPQRVLYEVPLSGVYSIDDTAISISAWSDKDKDYTSRRRNYLPLVFLILIATNILVLVLYVRCKRVKRK